LRGIPLSRIVGLVLLCLVVGLVLATLHITPRGLFLDTWATIRHIVDLFLSVGSWAIPYILLGALVVVPIAVVSWLLKGARRRG
jgi:hypothetical protein